MAKFFVGTSGFNYNSWKGFYPSELKRDMMLEFYAKTFNTVEINTTFYGIPRASTVNKWKAQVGDDFVFTFKMPKIITHNEELKFEIADLDKFLNALKAFSDNTHKHLILIQLPESTSSNPVQLKALTSALPDTFLYAFEFRHISWFNEEIYQILKKHNSTLVISDSPKKVNGKYMWPRKNIEPANFCYLRLHGSQKLYESSYTDEELNNYKGFLKEKMNRGMDIYCYFNNTIVGAGVENASKLKLDFS